MTVRAEMAPLVAGAIKAARQAAMAAPKREGYTLTGHATIGGVSTICRSVKRRRREEFKSPFPDTR